MSAAHLQKYQSVKLFVGEFHACVGEVFVNGEACEDMLWEPFSVELLPHLKPGKNQITLYLKTTLRNMIGPHHYQWDNKMYERGQTSTVCWQSEELLMPKNILYFFEESVILKITLWYNGFLEVF